MSSLVEQSIIEKKRQLVDDAFEAAERAIDVQESERYLAEKATGHLAKQLREVRAARRSRS